MQVVVADKCGFCHGVKDAIRAAEKTLSEKSGVYSLGPIIHNKDMVEHLWKKGLETVKNAEEIDAGTVIIRSHGAAPRQIKRLHEKGLNIVDCRLSIEK